VEVRSDLRLNNAFGVMLHLPKARRLRGWDWPLVKNEPCSFSVPDIAVFSGAIGADGTSTGRNRFAGDL
jgi:hypothetical protein